MERRWQVHLCGHSAQTTGVRALRLRLWPNGEKQQNGNCFYHAGNAQVTLRADHEFTQDTGRRIGYTIFPIRADLMIMRCRLYNGP